MVRHDPTDVEPDPPMHLVASNFPLLPFLAEAHQGVSFHVDSHHGTISRLIPEDLVGQPGAASDGDRTVYIIDRRYQKVPAYGPLREHEVQWLMSPRQWHRIDETFHQPIASVLAESSRWYEFYRQALAYPAVLGYVTALDQRRVLPHPAPFPPPLPTPGTLPGSPFVQDGALVPSFPVPFFPVPSFLDALYRPANFELVILSGEVYVGVSAGPVCLLTPRGSLERWSRSYHGAVGQALERMMPGWYRRHTRRSELIRQLLANELERACLPADLPSRIHEVLLWSGSDRLAGTSLSWIPPAGFMLTRQVPTIALEDRDSRLYLWPGGRVGVHISAAHTPNQPPQACAVGFRQPHPFINGNVVSSSLVGVCTGGKTASREPGVSILQYMLDTLLHAENTLVQGLNNKATSRPHNQPEAVLRQIDWAFVRDHRLRVQRFYRPET